MGRGEILFSNLWERRSFSDWDQTGRAEFADNPQAEAERLLSTHQAPPLEAARRRNWILSSGLLRKRWPQNER
jgi:trimethylamine:corrinoid methyltransferase-like protein